MLGNRECRLQKAIDWGTGRLRWGLGQMTPIYIGLVSGNLNIYH